MKKLATVFFLTLLGGTAYAQGNQLQLFYESPEGMRPAGYNSLEIELTATYSGLLDANGDGVRDLIMRREDNQGNLQELLVVDGRTREVIWEVQDVQALFGDANLDGFLDALGTGTPQALFSSSEDVFLIDPRDNSLAWSSGDFNGDRHTLIGVFDVTGDGFEDLLIFLPIPQKVQVWSSDQ